MRSYPVNKQTNRKTDIVLLYIIDNKRYQLLLLNIFCSIFNLQDTTTFSAVQFIYVKYFLGICDLFRCYYYQLVCITQYFLLTFCLSIQNELLLIFLFQYIFLKPICFIKFVSLLKLFLGKHQYFCSGFM